MTGKARWPGDRIRRALLTCASISWRGKFVGIVIADHLDESGEGFPGEDLLALETSLGVTAVKAGVAELKATGVYTLKRSGFQKVNRYVGHPTIVERLPRIPNAEARKRIRDEKKQSQEQRRRQIAATRLTDDHPHDPQLAATRLTEDSQSVATRLPSQPPHGSPVSRHAATNDLTRTTPQEATTTPAGSRRSSDASEATATTTAGGKQKPGRTKAVSITAKAGQLPKPTPGAAAVAEWWRAAHHARFGVHLDLEPKDWRAAHRLVEKLPDPTMRQALIEGAVRVGTRWMRDENAWSLAAIVHELPKLIDMLKRHQLT